MEGYVGVLYEEIIGRNIVEQPSAHSHRFVQISPLSLARLKLSCAGFVNAEGTQEPGYAPRTINHQAAHDMLSIHGSNPIQVIR